MYTLLYSTTSYADIQICPSLFVLRENIVIIWHIIQKMKYEMAVFMWFYSLQYLSLREH